MENPTFLFLGTVMLSVIGSSSRGSQLALFAVVLVLVSTRKHFLRNLLIFGALASATLYILPEEQVERFYSAGKDSTSELRLTYWEHAHEVIKQNPLGIGYQNWGAYYSAVYQP